MAERGRKKVNPDYNPVKARNEMAEAAARIYLHPEADMETDQTGKASMKAMKEYFGLTMTKIRKLLVTAGVYSFEKDGKDMVQEVQKLKAEGLSAKEISKRLSCSIGTVNSFRMNPVFTMQTSQQMDTTLPMFQQKHGESGISGSEKR